MAADPPADRPSPILPKALEPSGGLREPELRGGQSSLSSDSSLAPRPSTLRPGPSWRRAGGVIGGLALAIWLLASRAETGKDDRVTRLGRIEVTARLLKRPEAFPELGAYRYTYVLEYEVLKVHRQDPEGKYVLRPGDHIFVGHYKPWMPRSEIRDSAWGDSPLGGRLTQFVAGEAHRLALDYELQTLAPSGALDYCYPQGVNRFFAIWANPTGL